MTAVTEQSGRPLATEALPLRPMSPGALAAARRRQPPPRRARPLAVARAYLTLTKPRIVELLLVTTLPTMFLAAGGVPAIATLIVVLVGGALAAGAANALNCYIDRDIDQVMKRTATPAAARAHGVAALGAGVRADARGGVGGAHGGVHQPAGHRPDGRRDRLLRPRLHAVAQAHDAGEHGLGRRLRGGAGAHRLGRGDGRVAGQAWVLFAVVFLWQPPHFYALAIKFKDDYARAGIPMLPVVASMRRVGVEVVAYSWLTVAASLALWPLGMTPVYGLTAIAVGVTLRN